MARRPVFPDGGKDTVKPSALPSAVSRSGAVPAETLRGVSQQEKTQPSDLTGATKDPEQPSALPSESEPGG